MFDRAGKLNHLFKSTVSNFQLVMRHTFPAGSVAARPADAQHVIIERHFHIGRFNTGQIDFNDPAIFAAIHICRGTPQAAGGPALAIITNHAEVTFKRFAGHTDSSVSKSSEGFQGNRIRGIIEVSREDVSSSRNKERKANRRMPTFPGYGEEQNEYLKTRNSFGMALVLQDLRLKRRLDFT